MILILSITINVVQLIVILVLAIKIKRLRWDFDRTTMAVRQWQSLAEDWERTVLDMQAQKKPK
jgi:hypothetical protein